MRNALPALILLGLVLRIGYAVVIYEPSLLSYFRDDYELYRYGAEDILRGDLAFTNSLYLLRPPLYPLFLAAIGLQPFLVIAANILLGTAIIPLTYLLARHLNQSDKFALLAAAIVAVDLTSIKYASAMIAEPLANLFLALAFIYTLKLRATNSYPATVTRGLLSGAFIALSALTRPASYLLWIPMAIWIAFAKQKWRIPAACSLAAAGLLGVGAWTYHNSVTYQNSAFSTIGS